MGRSILNRYPKWIHHRIFIVASESVLDRTAFTTENIVSRVIDHRPLSSSINGKWFSKCSKSFSKATAPALLRKWGFSNRNARTGRVALWEYSGDMVELSAWYESVMGWTPQEYIERMREPS